jgi:hypothetical protein
LARVVARRSPVLEEIEMVEFASPLPVTVGVVSPVMKTGVASPHTVETVGGFGAQVSTVSAVLMVVQFGGRLLSQAVTVRGVVPFPGGGVSGQHA